MVSRIWKFFTEEKLNGKIKRKCLKCNALLTAPKYGRSTSNMVVHLRSKGHEDELRAYSGDIDMVLITLYY
jgi:hypothetical protein